LKFRWNVLFALLAVLLFTAPVFAQKYPLPGKKGAADVKCIGCGGTNEGKKTYPYENPLVRHAGRYVDSTTAISVQNAGMRTVRARTVRVNPDKNRIYIWMGEAVYAYKLDTFFTSKLSSMVSVSNVVTGWTYGGRNPLEKVAMPDAFWYAEAKQSGWTTSLVDSQKHLNDFDVDDRGYVYPATVYFGWGIAKDNGGTSGEHMDFVYQDQQFPLSSPDSIVSFRVGSRYYVAVSTNTKSTAGVVVYDVTTPSAPTLVATRRGVDYGMLAWAKSDDSQRLAYITADGRLRVYDYAGFASGSSPLAEYGPNSGRKLNDLSFDEGGRLWVAEGSNSVASNVLWRLSASGSGYTKAELDVYGQNFSAERIDAGGGYVAVQGRLSSGLDLALLKVDGASPRLLDTDNFFQKYYHTAPADYAQPGIYIAIKGVRVVEQGNKTFLMYSANSLGDVYEIEGGESISASQVAGTLGTPNPNARSTETGPFYGDILKFKATSNNPSATYTIEWDFDNLDSGNANAAQSALGVQVSHQFTGLNTLAEVSATKSVTAHATGDPSIADTVPVTLAVPKARIGVQGSTVPLTQENRVAFEAVAGDTFTDASDGIVEGHYTTWTIDGVATKKAPNATADVGALGAHTVAMSASYGKYNDQTFTSTAPYVTSVSSVSYTVKPFVVKLRAPESTSTAYIFRADARKTSNTAFLSATQWTVTWSVGGASAGTVSSQGVSTTAAQTVAVGTIPAFEVPKAQISNGTVVTLQVSVDPGTVPLPAYATITTSQTVAVPDPVVQITSGCTNASEPCVLKAASISAASTAGWNIEWTVKVGVNTVKTGTGLSLTFTPAEAGTYVATARETVFDKSAQKQFTVAGASCGPLPFEFNVNAYANCASGCSANTPIAFSAEFVGYQVQPCDTLSWTFGDNTTGTGASPTKTYTSNGTYQVKFNIKNATNTTGITVPFSVTVGSAPPTCTFPTDISFNVTGTYKTNEAMTFTARRNGGALQTCDTVRWSFDNETRTSKTQSYTFTTVGQHTVSLVVSNTLGESTPVTQSFDIAQGTTTGNCDGFVAEVNLGMEYFGPTSKCSTGSDKPCALNEGIQFSPTVFGYAFQACDRFEWNFGDGSAVSTSKTPTHAFTAQRNSYHVTMKVYNTNNPGGVTLSVDVPFAIIEAKPLPALSYAQPAPSSGTKGVPVAFTVNSNINATGWSWDFGDGTSVNNSQASVVAKTTTLQHTFNKTGTFTVSLRARNSEETNVDRISIAQTTLTITDTPEFKYLLPVVTHSPGQNDSVWRTDVQIYNPDPNATTPLTMTATLRDNSKTLEIFKSTEIYEDFMNRFTTGNDSGPVIITTRAKVAPQIWTRTYNQTVTGTFGQFIPAIRLDSVGGGSAVDSGKYYMAGLRNDASYRTNLGFLNPGLSAMPATVTVYDDTGEKVGSFTKTLQPFQLTQFPVNAPDAVPDLKGDRPFSVEIDVPTGQWVIAYASFISAKSNDPVFIQAIRESELASDDYREGVLPGVGHTGPWRSDVTVFNPNGRKINVDLAYHDDKGVKVGEAKNVPIDAGEFLQYDDLLRQGVFGSLPDSVGVLRVSVPATVSADRFPLTFARTYNDDGSGRTYGQGIGGFAAARANVKPGKPALIPGVRSNTKYYTNYGVTNVSSTDANVTISRLDQTTGVATPIQAFTVKPNQSIVGRVDLGSAEQSSLKIETTGGNIWAFCSIVDKGTFDPEYVAATPLGQ
jgi:PKD repeat protein